ncbi:Cell fate regulator YlbF, YheA/YmcA/DUF963 family (controls sporulation, competence, biofilm development) [Ligilactobacillus sp. WC1T17]|uniref:UPF0342 protein SAMN05216431_102151 n=1 Tax=Ligilactobacillus ruminis TaxID=1623 RepID=A0ABY1A9S3_9LACO|nr:Cell fate regulator YlbF, YheA/YmcA/DUF963 family (controls sporulation, competence, biofilm development) [Ligilactobacillus ruminis]
MINIYDTANQMEQDLRKTDEYQALKAAYQDLKADEKAYACFNKLHEYQGKLQQKQMQGETITEADFKTLQDLSQEANQYPSLMALMEKEQAINSLLDELSKIIFSPLQDIYHEA